VTLSPAGDAVDIDTRVDWRERQKLLSWRSRGTSTPTLR
jgi:hypothetical protein